MSQPPPYGTPPNTDTRPLPPGWIEQFDRNYNAWFYVNTAENPPRSSWVHPLGPPPPPPQQGFAPPPGAPPANSPYPGSYNQGYQGSAQPQYGGGYPPQGGYPGGYQQSYQQEAPPQRGWFGGGAQQSPQPQTVYQQAPPKKSGMGMGTAVLAGGAGLVGGALLAEAFEDHDDHEREEGYQDGYQDGQDNDFDGGGGDW